MSDPPAQPPIEDDVDEAVAESFPASDPPSWTPAHAGSPSHRRWALEHGHDLRAAIRADLERLARAAQEHDPAALEHVVARAMLDAGRAVVREPVGGTLGRRNVEAELIGAERAAPSVVVGARYDDPDPSGVAVQLAMVRALTRERLRRTIHFVAFTREGGSAHYVERLRRDGKTVAAMLSLARLDLARRRRAATVLFVGNFRSTHVARSARDAFRVSSRIAARALTLPGWFPGVESSDHAAFWRQRWPGVMVTDRQPWAASEDRFELDVDGMAAVVPGLVAAVARLAGGRV